MTSLPSTAQIDKARNMKLPDKIYFHIAESKELGWYIRETPLYCWELEQILAEVDDDTVAVILLEDGVETDVSEDIAAAWFKANRNEIEIDAEFGEAWVSDFIRNHCADLIADLEGEIAAAKLNEQHHNEHQFSRAS